MNLNPAAVSNRTVITYIDATTVVNDVPSTTTPLTGNGNSNLEQGELMRSGMHIEEGLPSTEPFFNLD